MESNCPNCKNKMDHEDYLFEVVCSKCQTRYNPFYEKFDGGEEVEEVPAVSSDFKESTNAFQEIVQFGEELGNVGAPGEAAPAPPLIDDILANTPDAETPAAPAPASAPKPRKAAAPIVPVEGEVLMTSGDTFAGFRIVNYLPPHSVWTDSNPELENPLEGAFMVLWEKCTQKGANAIIAIQWRFTPDGNRILVSGTPVQCEKE